MDNSKEVRAPRVMPGGRPKGVPNKITLRVRAMAQSIVEDPVYLANLKQDAINRTLHPTMEQLLYYYAYGKPADKLIVREEQPGDFNDASIEELREEAAQRAAAILSAVKANQEREQQQQMDTVEPVAVPPEPSIH